MIVLDTNVISELIAPARRAPCHCMGRRPTGRRGLPDAITTAELRYRVARLTDARRRADIVTHRERRGLPISMADAQIAAICGYHRAGLSPVRNREASGITEWRFARRRIVDRRLRHKNTPSRWQLA